MSVSEDYYELLGLTREADPDDIKRSYRKLAFQYHPDRNPGNVKSEDMFKKVSEAYEVLSDPNKRQIYDQFGHAGLQGHGGFHGGFHTTEDIFSAFGDIFEDFFGFSGMGRHARGPRPQKGRDMQVELTIEFLEACFGIEREVEIFREVLCKVCEGSGAKPGTKPVSCSYCHGSGQVHATQGFFTIRTTCPRCQGMGTQIKDPCPKCHGQKRIRQPKKLKVKIPAGIQDTMRLLLSEEGETGQHGGPAGDIYVLVHVRDHPLFRREGDDIFSQIEIPFPHLALGLELHVDTIDGEETIPIKAGTQSGDVMSLRGKGVANVRTQRRGDHLITIQGTIPTKLSKEQKELFEKLSETLELPKAKPEKKKKKGFFS